MTVLLTCAGAALGAAAGALLCLGARRVLNEQPPVAWLAGPRALALCSALAALLSAAVLPQYPHFPGAALALSSLWLALFHALTDMADGYIYDAAVLVSFGVAFALRSFFGARLMLLEISLGAGAGWTPLALIILLTRGSMGWGDASMMAGLGALMGWKLTLLTLYAGFIAGGAAALVLLVLGRVRRGDVLPLAPFLALGTAIALIFGQKLFSWLGTGAGLF